MNRWIRILCHEDVSFGKVGCFIEKLHRINILSVGKEKQTEIPLINRIFVYLLLINYLEHEEIIFYVTFISNSLAVICCTG